MNSWSVYIVECADTTLYTGVTTDVERRVWEHNNSKKGAKYTKSKRPVKLVYTEACDDKTGAMQREYVIKKLTRDKKQELVSQFNKS